MMHKRAYFRGLCKIAIALLKTTYGAQVGRGTRTNTLPTTDVMVKDKAQTYGDLGFQDTGLHHVNWAGLDKRKDLAAKQGKQYVPSFIEFITDKNIAGLHYIPRDSINRMSHEMARIRGGRTPLSKRNVDYSDTLKYLNAAYKHGRLLDYSNDNKDDYLSNALSAYTKYLDTRSGTPYKDTNKYNTDPEGTSDEPDEVPELPTTPAADKLGTAPLISPKQQQTVFTSDYAKRFFTAYNKLMSDTALRDAYVAGRTTYGKERPQFVGLRFTEAGYTDFDPLDAYSQQRAYQEDWRKVRDTLGKDDKWMYNNLGKLYDLYSKYNQNPSN